MVTFHVVLIVLVTSFGRNALLFIKETMELESSRTRRSLQLLTKLMVSVVHIVTGDSFYGGTIFGP